MTADSLEDINSESPQVNMLKLLDEYNVHAKSFRMVRDRLTDSQVDNVKLRLIAAREKNGRTYNLPNVSEVDALIVGDFDPDSRRDIIVETQNGELQRIHELHSSYDRVTAVVIHDANGTLENTITQNDEIKEYVDRRYISPCEATWRIFGFPIHARKPAVERLHFHLPGQHNVVYEDDDDIDDILSKPSISDSKFLAWMNSNKCFSEELHIDDEQLKNLTLLEIEKLLHANQKSLRDYPTMPYLEGANPASCLENSLILSELNYNNDEARSEFENLFLSMTDIGDGVIGNQNDGYATIEIPEYLLIIEYNDPIDAIVKSTFTDLYQYHSNPEFFKSRAILASTNETVEEVK
ncbi:uncharacterized protein [Glycine max]|uniref:uncharacterized protein n=1 Tax=Glycine max TaxID=3847 RepID=UPI000E21C176|nr:uncharacterized protein LOC100792184 [Glycine max]|eukprot:XP_025983183.1 uncharacterized protein LOC100792184 [Glycine max]